MVILKPDLGFLFTGFLKSVKRRMTYSPERSSGPVYEISRDLLLASN